jgi:hypothetical protein
MIIGCLEFHVYQIRDDSRSFLLWSNGSEDALFAHGKRDMADYMAQKSTLESLGGDFLEDTGIAIRLPISWGVAGLRLRTGRPSNPD